MGRKAGLEFFDLVFQPGYLGPLLQVLLLQRPNLPLQFHNTGVAGLVLNGLRFPRVPLRKLFPTLDFGFPFTEFSSGGQYPKSSDHWFTSVSAIPPRRAR